MEPYKPTPKELQETLRLHKMWLNNERSGKRAIMDNWSLRNASLNYASLDGASLNYASLDGASLRNASLDGASLDGASLDDASLDDASLNYASLDDASLVGASLVGASLVGASLNYASLDGASLRNASLNYASLDGASLVGASLDGAKNFYVPLACPSHGAFTAWKKACYCPDKIATPEKTKQVIVELLIPSDAKRSSATTRKCRCDKAQVVSITDLNGNSYDTAFSLHDCRFIYKVGETVSVPDYDDNRWNECSTGIHFFIDRQGAVEWQ